MCTLSQSFLEDVYQKKGFKCITTSVKCLFYMDYLLIRGNQN